MDFLTDPFLVDPDAFDGPVLVTGAAGCIGAWTAAILARSGVPVVAADLGEDRRRPGLVMGVEAAQALTWVSCDVTDGAAVARIVADHGIRAIIHLAGLQVPFCKADPAMGARVNVEGTINILEAARHAGIKRLAYASSTARHGMPPGSKSEVGEIMATLYGAYKLANEYTARVYWLDWGVPSVGIRPNVVYGVGRDQGMTSLNTQAIAHAVMGTPFEVTMSGPLSWLYAGEAAAGFIAAVSKEGDGASVFDMNGTCLTIEDGMAELAEIAGPHRITVSGAPLAVPQDLSDAPLRDHVGTYPSIAPRDGIAATHRAFAQLHQEGRLRPTA